MPKQYNIKWRPSDYQMIANRVRAFNGKLTRLINKNPEIANYLPKRVSTSQIREQVKTRNDLNNILNSLSRFSRKGAENPINTKSGIQTTAWQIKEATIRVGVINRRRKAELKRLNPSTEKGTMGSIEENNLRPKRFNPDRVKVQDWDKLLESINAQSRSSYAAERASMYKANYLKALWKLYSPITAELYEEIYQIVTSLPDEKVYSASFDDPVLTIGFTYDPLQASLIMEESLMRWKSYAGV